jgi:predicted enzyme related to lactoylglutathione lyase
VWFYFGSRAQQTMLNFRVRDLDAKLAQLRSKGADVDGETQNMESVRRFGWVTDPEGNRVELWQPARPRRSLVQRRVDPSGV